MLLAGLVREAFLNWLRLSCAARSVFQAEAQVRNPKVETSSACLKNRKQVSARLNRKQVAVVQA